MTILTRQKNGSKLHQRVTIADVSEALGMNKSTVSRALNNYDDISESTRRRVRSVSEKMGYKPLSYAQAIRTKQTKSLGLVIQLADHDAYRPFLAEFIAGVSEGASADGWTLTVATARTPEATIETIKTLIRDGKADGFILARTLIDDPRIELLRDSDVPFILFGRSPDPTGCAWHDVLGEDAMRDAVHHLAELGHSKIGFINGGVAFNYAPLRLGGFLAGMADVCITPDPAQIKENALTLEDGARAAFDILATKVPPTAIVCALDVAALGVYRVVADLGLHVGADVSVVGYDGIPEGAHLSPMLSTFAVDHMISGRRLSDLLIRRIKGDDLETLRELVPATFKDRGSTGRPRQTSQQLAELFELHGHYERP